ncbi:MAG: DEAD/DEAH box helicase [Cytophagales bacterium]|nr:DEAD/DEAH box helicase [Cytophagales bacterium]
MKALHSKGYVTPTPIQKEAIPSILNRNDVIGSAQTGTGKTAAFCIPILEILSNRKYNKGVKALILTPTRELAIQISDNLSLYGKYLPIEHALIYGGVKQNQQVKQIQKGAEILIATPGRLIDLMNQGLIDLGNLEILVLDEADRMLDMGFIHDIRKIIVQIPRDRQNVFFSATIPQGIQKLIKSFMRSPVKINVKATHESKANIDQFVYYVNKKSKRALLKHIISENDMNNVLVFSRTKHGANRIVRDLIKSGISAEAIHSDRSQQKRQRALHNFKRKTTRVLVATDIAARGIDINDLPFVINFELPETAETYTHRIGRTGRAGSKGYAFSMCDVNEKNYLKNINKISEKRLMTIEHPFV